MNKVVELPFDSEEVAEQEGLKELLEQSKGKIWIEEGYRGDYEGTFVDKDGNVAKFFIDREGNGIKSLSEEARTVKGVTQLVSSAIIRQVSELGFKYQEPGIYLDYRIIKAGEKYRRAIEKEQEDSKDKGFNF